MNGTSKKWGRRDSTRVAAIVVSLAMVAAACGSSSGKSSSAPPSSGTTTSAGSTSGAKAPMAAIGSAEYVATLKKAFLTSTPPADLSPIVTEALRVFAVPTTAAQATLFKKCVKESTCTLGKGPLRVGVIIDTTNTIQLLYAAHALMQSIKYPQIGSFTEANANGTIAGWLTGYRSLISQGDNIILTDTTFGPAILPSLRAAEQKGVTVELLAPPLAQAKPTDYGTDTFVPICAVYTAEAQRAVQVFGKNGTYGMYTGIPGNSNAAAWQPCLQKVLSAAGWKMAISGNTGWTPAGENAEGAALLASGKKVDAIFYDYDYANLLRPFVSAGKTPPAAFGESTTSDLWQYYIQEQKAGVTLQAYFATSEVWYEMVLITLAVRAKEGESNPKQLDEAFSVGPLKDRISYYDPAYPSGTPMLPLLDSDLAIDVLKQ